ncbi:MAG TPA: HEAT repeat domain-containing protein [Flavobacteriales bacterium]|nr:HEAT repeat domain-containing protein [Flavobacteriales bacterium]
MTIEEVFASKTLKPKQKTETLYKLVVSKKVSINALLTHAKSAKDSAKATCIEALEMATKNDAKLGNTAVLDFVTNSLAEKAPRIKWESAKVIGNIAGLYAGKLEKAISHLLTNTEHEGAVVRWSAAYALGEILKTKHPSTKKLIPAIEAICLREEKNSIKKVYLAALKNIK